MCCSSDVFHRQKRVRIREYQPTALHYIVVKIMSDFIGNLLGVEQGRDTMSYLKYCPSGNNQTNFLTPQHKCYVFYSLCYFS